MRGLSCPSSILDHAKKFKNHLLELNFHNSIGEIVQSEAINIDRFGERQEIIEEHQKNDNEVMTDFDEL
jgi:hypothetical protein